MRGADALVRALERAGVDTVFGVPGGACLPVYDALYDSSIRHVLMRHEAAAAHAAEGYARASERGGAPRGRVPGRAGGSLWRSPPAARARRTWSRRSPTPTWTRRRRCSSPA